MPRSVPEWLGKTLDSQAPPRVRLRNLAAHGNKCGISGLIIRAGDAWETDHKIPLIAGGENRESNLHPVLSKYHKIKTAREMVEKAKVAKSAKAVMGVKSKKPKIKSPGFEQTREPARITKQSLPPLRLYQDK